MSVPDLAGICDAVPGKVAHMQSVEVGKNVLLSKLGANRLRHRRVFEAALAGYRKEAERRLEELLAALRAGQVPRLDLDLVRPEDHTLDYDRVIHMVEMHTGDSLTVDEQTFRCYVEDDWRWKRQFVDTSSIYAAAMVDTEYGHTLDLS